MAAEDTKTGKIVAIIGPVVDVEFEGGRLPEIYNALRIARAEESEGQSTEDVIAEVEQHLGENRVRAVAMTTTDGLRRGMVVVDTGAPISVPVSVPIYGAVAASWRWSSRGGSSTT